MRNVINAFINCQPYKLKSFRYYASRINAATAETHLYSVRGSCFWDWFGLNRHAQLVNAAAVFTVPDGHHIPFHELFFFRVGIHFCCQSLLWLDYYRPFLLPAQMDGKQVPLFLSAPGQQTLLLCFCWCPYQHVPLIRVCFGLVRKNWHKYGVSFAIVVMAFLCWTCFKPANYGHLLTTLGDVHNWTRIHYAWTGIDTILRKSLFASIQRFIFLPILLHKTT